MFQRLFLIWLSVSATATAQIDPLVTNGDGSIAYFSSTLRLLGDGSEVNWSKLFRYRQDTGKIELAYQVTTYSKVNAWGGTTPFILEFPDISSDGSTLVYTGQGGPCGVIGSTCLSYVGALGYVAKGSQPIIVAEGSVRLSRNGRYVLAFPYYSGPWSSAAITTFRDMQSGPAVHLGLSLFPVNDGYQIVSDMGTALVGTSIYNLQQRDPAQPILAGTPLKMSQTPVVERLSADGKRIVYEAYVADHPVLILYEVDSGRESVLVRGAVGPAAAPNSPILHPWISDDASTVLYLDSPGSSQTRQIFLISTDGTGTVRQLSNEPEGIVSAVLSGSGNVIYAVTASNRILQIQTASGIIREISGANITVSGSGVPGSFARLTGLAIPTDSGPGAVKIGGLDAPVLQATSTVLDVQTPWDLELPDLNGSPIPVTFKGQSGSVFEPTTISISYVSPAFLRLSPSTTYGALSVIAHQDFHGLVTPDDRARPGEILHFYMTGLGPVSPSIGTGEVTPAGTLYPVTGPPTCLFNAGVPAALLFAGLAPGTVGIYQVDVQMPTQPGPNPGFACNGYLSTMVKGDFVLIPTGL